MRTLPTGLKDAIMEGKTVRLLKITLKDGTVKAFNDGDKFITVDGVLYKPAPGLSSVKYTSRPGTEISNQEVGAALLDVPHDDLIAGKYDEAEVEAARASWEQPELGRDVIFRGRLGEVRWDERGFVADVVDNKKALERNLGWTYTSSCRHELFGTAEAGRLGYCGVNPASYTFSGSISSITLNKWKFVISVAQADGYFSNGVITFTSGNNAGLSATIKNHASNQIDLFISTAFGLQVGDTFTITAGCDKTAATCSSKFSNLNNFGGFPHIQQDVSFR